MACASLEIVRFLPHTCFDLSSSLTDFVYRTMCRSTNRCVYADMSFDLRYYLRSKFNPRFNKPRAGFRFVRFSVNFLVLVKISARKRNNQHTEEFIELYKSLPCLWKVKSKEYHDRVLRDSAYEQLVNKMKETEPEATKHSNKRNMRRRRSQERHQMNCTRYYYDLFDFLGDQDTPRESTSNLDDENTEHEEDDVNEDTHDEQTQNDGPTLITEDSDNPPTSKRPKSKKPIPLRPTPKRNDSDQLTTDVLVTVRDHFKKPNQ
ncbi:hypothetical protein FQR65_LT13796 [Abscondita terminalis]|nr:hypothetical protein FQR65_LT13796 [Abscondita terminalis]